MSVNKYKIGATDLYSTCGLMVESGWSTFLQFRKRKPVFANDWAEQNGKEYDLAAPVFEDRTFKIKGVIEASSAADFWAKHTALFNLLSAAGKLDLTVVELGKTFKVFFLDMNVLSIPTAFASATQIVVQIEIQLQEVQQ